MSIFRKESLVRGALALLLVLSAAWFLLPRDPQPVRASLLAAAAGEPAASGFALADGRRPLVFPADHGSHPDYRTEWWYYTGNLTAPGGEAFGYQLTFFRRSLTPPAERSVRASSWATDEVYLAHFAVTDVAAGSHQPFERLTRGAAGLAGSQAQPFHVWLEDWSVQGENPGQATLRAQAEGVSLELALRDTKGPILQGDRGYSRKGDAPGNASYYYSLTRLDSAGQITVAGRTYAVTGLSWMDHEFSTSALEKGVAGWDWFSLQLTDGSELMVYLLRQADGSAGVHSSATFIASDGHVQTFSAGDLRLRRTGEWRSPHTGAVYPAGWNVEVPALALQLNVTPREADQEMNLSYTYWEGAVSVTGTSGGAEVRGHGYVELTGYAGSLGGQF